MSVGSDAVMDEINRRVRQVFEDVLPIIEDTDRAAATMMVAVVSVACLEVLIFSRRMTAPAAVALIREVMEYTITCLSGSQELDRDDSR